MKACIVSDCPQPAQQVANVLTQLMPEGCPPRTITTETALLPAGVGEGLEGILFYVVDRITSPHLDLLRGIRAAADPSATVVIVSTVRDHGEVLSAIRAGAQDCLCLGEGFPAELCDFFRRNSSQQQASTAGGRVVSVVPCYAPGDASMLAVNLASVLAQRLGTCNLLDFHLRGGDLAILLKLAPRHTVIDLLRQEHVDDAMFRQALTPHESGVRLLAGPDTFVDLSAVRPQACQQIVELARQSHPFVVINSEDAQHADQIRAIAASDQVLLTMRLDIVSLHRAKQHIEFMTSHSIPLEQIHVVALGVCHSHDLPLAAVKKALHIATPLHSIPDDPVAIMRSVNVGNPLVLEEPRHKISQAIASLADRLTGPTQAQRQTPSKVLAAAVQAAAVAAANSLSMYK